MPDQPRLPVVFAIFQTGDRANGGVESITQILERTEGIAPIVVTQMETPVNDRWRAAGCEVHVWPLAHTARLRRSGFGLQDVQNLWAFNVRLYRLLQQTGCRVLHCNDTRLFWYGAPGARAAGAAVVLNVRDTKPPDEPYGWSWRLIALLSNRMMALSREMRDYLARRLPGIGRERIDYAYSIVDLDRMRPLGAADRAALRARLGLPEAEVAIGYVATFNEKKAQLRFIEEAGPELARRLPGARVYFVGDFHPERDAYARQCRERVRSLGLEDTFRFVGYSSEVAAWYQALDLVVLASRREGLARCMIESLACGTPVVSFDVCSAREVLEGYDCGYVVPQGDYRALVERVAELADHPAQRQQVGARGEQSARHLFNARHVVAAYEAFYRRVASMPGHEEPMRNGHAARQTVSREA